MALVARVAVVFLLRVVLRWLIIFGLLVHGHLADYGHSLGLPGLSVVLGQLVGNAGLSAACKRILRVELLCRVSCLRAAVLLVQLLVVADRLAEAQHISHIGLNRRAVSD